MNSRMNLTVITPLMAAVVFVVIAVTTGWGVLALWLGAGALMIVSAFGAWAQERRPESRRSSFFLIATTFVVTASLGAAVTLQNVDQASDAPVALTVVQAQSSTINAIAIKPQELTYSGATREVIDARAKVALDEVSAITTVSGRRAEGFIHAAESAGYVTNSGLKMNFIGATVSLLGSATYISVPLQSDGIPELTKVTFVYDGKQTTVIEMVANVVDESHAGVRVWQNGTIVKNVQVHDPSLDSTGSASVLSVGFSMSKLKSCLNNAGVSAWLVALIGATCAVVCAATVGAACLPCVVAILGFTSGSIAACVYLAFR